MNGPGAERTIDQFCAPSAEIPADHQSVQNESGYVRVMIAYLPASLRGVMLAAFAAAYMSTIATQLNWGASYVVNDFYRRFIRSHADDGHYVLVSK